MYDGRQVTEPETWRFQVGIYHMICQYLSARKCLADAQFSPCPTYLPTYLPSQPVDYMLWCYYTRLDSTRLDSTQLCAMMYMTCNWDGNFLWFRCLKPNILQQWGTCLSLGVWLHTLYCKSNQSPHPHPPLVVAAGVRQTYLPITSMEEERASRGVWQGIDVRTFVDCAAFPFLSPQVGISKRGTLAYMYVSNQSIGFEQSVPELDGPYT